jgi:hypothetical protein
MVDLNYLKNCLQKELDKYPLLITKEDDLKSYLYMKIFLSENYSNIPVPSENLEIFPLHTEYPRLYYNDENILYSKNHRYDIAVLCNSDKPEFVNADPLTKKVQTAFELKISKNSRAQTIQNIFCDDLPAFNSKSGQALPDKGIIFILNYSKKSESVTEVIELVKEGWEKKNDDTYHQYCPVSFCYVETYLNSSANGKLVTLT